MAKKSEKTEAASTLASVRHGVAAHSAASEAARALARRRVELAGHDELARIGKMGAEQYWARLTPAERRLEIKRRRSVARRNKKARIGQILK